MPVKRRHFDPFGIREIVTHLTGKTAGEPFFSVRGRATDGSGIRCISSVS